MRSAVTCQPVPMALGLVHVAPGYPHLWKGALDPGLQALSTQLAHSRPFQHIALSILTALIARGASPSQHGHNAHGAMCQQQHDRPELCSGNSSMTKFTGVSKSYFSQVIAP